MSYLAMLAFSQIQPAKHINLSSQSHEFHPPGTPEFDIYLSLSIFVVCLAGICSGLNVGYLSIDQLQLQVMLKSGTEIEKQRANKVIPILKNHHLLLSTLLVANAIAMEALPIFLHQIVPAAASVIISTIVVLIFGEIVPQALCTGPRQLQIAAFSTPIIMFFEFILWPICYPIAKFLDLFLGIHEVTKFPKKDIKALIEIHQTSDDQTGHLQHFGFNQEEVRMLKSTLELRDQKVCDKMIPIDNVYMLSTDSFFDRELIKEIHSKGYSMIPIYKGNDKTCIEGVLRTKYILKCEEKHLNKPIANRFPLTNPLMIVQDTTMLQMIQIFQSQKSSMAFITDEIKNKNQDENKKLYMSNKDMIVENYNQILGIICLKDVFEEIIDRDFQDDDANQNIIKNYEKKFKQSRQSLSQPLIE